MKKMMKRTSAVLFAIVMMMALVACGSGEDTKESVQKTIDDLQAKMTEVTQGYQNAFTDQEALKDPTKAGEAIDKAVDLIDQAIDACDSIDAPGPDSQKYRDMCKGLFEVFKNMMNEFRGTDMSDKESATKISQKYMGEIMSKTSEATKFVQELQQKYGVTIPTTAPTTTDTTATE